jgi:hypothetical protein
MDFTARFHLSEAQNSIPLPPYTLYTCILYTQGKGVGRVDPERRLEGQQFTKLGRK